MAVALDADTPISDELGTLGDVVRKVLEADRGFVSGDFDERHQLDVGSHLYDQTLGRLERDPPPRAGQVSVHVVTEDEHIARLPWVLLARSGRFLSASGWAITLCRSIRQLEPRSMLPPSPKILVAAPQPKSAADTQSAAHLEDLELMLTAADHRFERGVHLRVVTTWKEFREVANEIQPDAFYYYGHGFGDDRTSSLVFADRRGRRHKVPMANVAHCLRRLDKPPVVAYVNCCLGDAGGLLGAGWQLGDVVPAVVTNRTIVLARAARTQAKTFWRAVLLDGAKPHDAISEMYGQLGEQGFGFHDARWMTPVLHRHYDDWKSYPPKPGIEDDFWHVKLDRVPQFGQLVFETQKMLNDRRPRCLGYLWYGQEGQGVDLFHLRIKVELQEYLGEHHLYEIRPRWPDDLSDPYPAFEKMMLDALELQSLDNLSGRIRGETLGEAGRDAVIYVRHEPVKRGEVMKPAHLNAYLEWWDDVFVPRLEDPAFGLLGISFIVNKPKNFKKLLLDYKLDDPTLDRIDFHILGELGPVDKNDLLNFLKTHKIVLPRASKDQILDDVLKKTGGHYEKTLEKLRKLVRKTQAKREAETKAPKAERDW